MWWWVSMRPGAMRSAKRRDSGLRDLLVLARLHAGDADRADAFALVDDRHRALDQEPGREIGEGRPFLDAVFPEFGRLLGERGGFCLAGGDGRRDRGRPVHALEAEQGGAVVDDRDRDLPVVLL